MDTENKEWLFGKTLSQIEEIVAELGGKKYVSKQITDWLYKKNANHVDDMLNLSKQFRAEISKKYCVGFNPYYKVDTSKDGTRKYLFKTLDDTFIESAYIPDRDRATLCVSSQGGCRMGCLFCMTGRQKLQQNLTAGEILNQVKSIDETQSLNNVVYMGMGEPLDNADEVLRSIEILTSEWGYAWSPTRITLSTIGILPMVKRFVESSKANLTISMHSPNPKKRAEIMPVEKKYSILEIVKLLRNYDFSHQRRLTFGYTMFKGVNDTITDANDICTLLKGMHCRINIIPFHQIPDSNLSPTPHEDMVKFRDYLSKKGFTCTIRASRGEDIFAACGLLSTKEQQLNEDFEK